MEQKLNWKDIRLLGTCGLIFLVSLLVGTHFFYKAFPEATIDFKITRDDARDRGSAFLQHRGFDIGAYRHSAIFTFDDMAKTFLERELGLEEAMAVIGDPVRLWRWSNRWVVELQKEEFQVEYTTSGDLVGFAREIEEEREGASLEQQKARYLAEQFLSHTMGHDLADLEFVEATTTERPHRTDHSFTWKLVDFEISEATYRIRVGIQGDLVGSYAEFLKIPEVWLRDYDTLRASNETSGVVASAFMVFAMLAMMTALIKSIRVHDVAWKTVAVFGSIAFVLTFLSQLNMLPVTEYYFNTTETFGSFFAGELLSGLLKALMSGLVIAVLTAGAEPVYRRGFPNHISLSEQFLPNGLRTKQFLISTVIGLTMTPLIVAYQTVFYIIANSLGAWSPSNIQYSEMVNTHIPWVVVLLIGFMPAVSEEFMSRAFSIPFLQRFIRYRWVAVVIPALIWGFAHTGYPQQPFYIRGIEVGLIGILLGYVMIRWGILPALIWHYTIDALYTALVLLRSSNDYFVISAAISVGIMLLPLLAATLLYIRHRFFVDPTPLLNNEDSPDLALQKRDVRDDLNSTALPSETAFGEVAYVPLPCRRLLTTTAIVGIVSTAVFLVDTEDSFDFIDAATTPNEARLIADEYLTERGIDTGTYRQVVSPSVGVDGTALKYRLERKGIVNIDTLYREDLHPAEWTVRYFRPLEKEEYEIRVDMSDGTVTGVEHLLKEESPGAELNEEEALAIARASLREFGLDLETLDLKSSSSEKLDVRTDHHFIWQAADGDPRNLEEAYYRVDVDVAGDETVSLSRFIKLPEEWLRAYEERTTLQAVLNWSIVAFAIGIVLHLLWLLVRRVGQGDIAWKPLLILGAIGAAISLLRIINGLPTLYALYPTEQPDGLFITKKVIGFIMGSVTIGIAVTTALGFAVTLYPDCLKQLRHRPAIYFKDAVWLALLGWLATVASHRIHQLASQPFAPFFIEPPDAGEIVGLSTFLPAWEGFSLSLGAALVMPVMYGIAIYYALRVLKRPSFVIAAIIIFGTVASGADAHNQGEFYFSLASFLYSTGVQIAIVAVLLRDNLVAYILLGFWSASLEPSVDMLSQTALLYQIHGWIWLGASVVSVAMLWFYAIRKN